MPRPQPELSAAQAEVYRRLTEAAVKWPLVALTCRSGNGRTTLLRRLADEVGARFVGLPEIAQRTAALHPLHIEEGLMQTLLAALAQPGTVVLDDLHVALGVFDSCYMGSARPRMVPLALDAVLACLGPERRLVFGSSHRAPAPFDPRCVYVGMQKFTVDDFRFLFRELMGAQVADVDFDRVFRFVPRLDVHQMKYVANLLAGQGAISTEQLLDFLEKHALASNVDQAEVRPVTLESLHGVEDVLRSLYADIIIPMERTDLAQELGLEPKRGVLLYGPPGTGKTTIGRALAHRLRNKFFLIDGTFIAGTQNFYERIQRVFEEAKACAPSLIFIDDSDVIFEDPEETGLYRYLLTMLDGLESESASKVTIMMTAMNIGSLPPALIRSGRVELWLAMDPPDARARAQILRDLLASRAERFRKIDVEALAGQTDGMTGADLRRLVTDAINLHAYDIVQGGEARDVSALFDEARNRLQQHRQRLAQAPRFTAAHHGRASRAFQAQMEGE